MRRVMVTAMGALALWSLGSAPLRAQDTRAAIERGIELREQNRDEEALAVFQAAYAQDPSAELLAQIALAEAAVGRWMAADLHLRQALQATTDPWIQSRRAQLEPVLETFAQHLGSLELVGGVQGAEVRVNGEVVAQMPLSGPLRIPAGVSTVEVEAPGYYRFAREVQVSAGGMAREEVRLVPEAAVAGDPGTRGASPGEPIETELHLSPMLVAATVVTGVGLLGAAVLGSVFLVLRNNYNSNDFSVSRGLVQTIGVLTDVSFGLAALGGGLALLSLFLDPSGERPVAVSALPWVTADGAGLVLRGVL